MLTWTPNPNRVGTDVSSSPTGSNFESWDAWKVVKSTKLAKVSSFAITSTAASET